MLTPSLASFTCALNFSVASLYAFGQGIGVGSTTLIVMPFLMKNATPGDTRSLTLSTSALPIVSPVFTCAFAGAASARHAPARSAPTLRRAGFLMMSPPSAGSSGKADAIKIHIRTEGPACYGNRGQTDLAGAPWVGDDLPK